ncbi:hypothetical protein L210DRAFT_3524592 [Boletus edulis BED1]|uniref:Uncharacterized protein n=1 Tax=Boletus edulis BED1 TaxID=1328754 RepID=A0AAD4BB29_BOLED|nr:hypothetical protein L210DRAFT_3585937 [Boletus edulis BED1]KAF8449329.1 hypothetical protein L210DRAFT_3524592 [Boletus edulis BED1]
MYLRNNPSLCLPDLCAARGCTCVNWGTCVGNGEINDYTLNCPWGSGACVFRVYVHEIAERRAPSG